MTTTPAGTMELPDAPGLWFDKHGAPWLVHGNPIMKASIVMSDDSLCTRALNDLPKGGWQRASASGGEGVGSGDEERQRIRKIKAATCQGCLAAAMGLPLHTVAESGHAPRSYEGDAWEQGWEFINGSATWQMHKSEPAGDDQFAPTHEPAASEARMVNGRRAKPIECDTGIKLKRGPITVWLIQDADDDTMYLDKDGNWTDEPKMCDARNPEDAALAFIEQHADRPVSDGGEASDLTCESHPGKAWPHDDCPGPGMPWANCERIIAQLRSDLSVAEAERDKWKSNHDEMVSRNRLLRARSDLTVEQIAELEGISDRLSAAEAKVAELEKQIPKVIPPCAECGCRDGRHFKDCPTAHQAGREG